MFLCMRTFEICCRTNFINVHAYNNLICNVLYIFRVHVHTSAFLSKYIPKTDLPDYQIAETMCEGTETSLVDCKMTMVPAMSCNIAVGIMCSSGNNIDCYLQRERQP